MNKSNSYGDQGENLVAFLLSKIAFISPIHPDTGEDFLCRLRDYEFIQFYIQSKASNNPKYSSETIYSLPIDDNKFKKWLDIKYPLPVYLFMTDLLREKIYYYKISNIQKNKIVEIPLIQEISKENIGFLFEELIKNSKLSLKNKKKSINKFRKEYPQFFQDIKKIDYYLEGLINPNQEILFSIKQEILSDDLIKSLNTTTHPSSRLINGIHNIFRISQDRIQQNHLLDIIVGLNIKQSIPDIIAKIDYNQSNLDALITPGIMKHALTDFLFDGLIKLGVNNIYDYLEKYFNSSENPFLIRGVTKYCGHFKISKGWNKIIKLLSSNDFGIRYEACIAISNYPLEKVKDFCNKINNYSGKKLTSCIEISTILKLKGKKDYILSLINSDDFIIRKKIIKYIGALKISKYYNLLFNSLIDEHYEVSNEATLAINSSGLSNEEKVEKILTIINSLTISTDNYLKINSLIGVFYSLPKIYAMELENLYTQVQENIIPFTYTNEEGNECNGELGLKRNLHQLIY